MQGAHQTSYSSTLLIRPATENDLASADPERMVPIVWAPERFMLVVTGIWRQGGLTRLFARATREQAFRYDHLRL